MHTYFAQASNAVVMGSFRDCVRWGIRRLDNKQASIVKIIKARPQDTYGQIIFEITRDDGLVSTPNGRQIRLSTLKRAEKYGKKESL